MPPIQFQDEVFIFSRRAESTGGLASAVNHAVLDAPGFRRTIDIDPTGQIPAVEEGHPILIRTINRGAGKQGHQESQASDHDSKVSNAAAKAIPTQPKEQRAYSPP